MLRTDRTGALGRSQARRFVLHPPTVNFARYHGVVIAACQARDAKRKGKVERRSASSKRPSWKSSR